MKRRLSLKSTGEHQYRIEHVSVDTNARTITFPIGIEQTKGNIEYALTGIKGKLHETLLMTEVMPAQVHYATQLLKVPKNAPVKITITWKTHGPARSVSLEELVQITQPSKRNSSNKSPWIYQGSRLFRGKLLAQLEDNFISLISDPAALVVHKSAHTINRDDIYLPRKGQLPKKGLPLTLTLSFPN